MKNNDKNIVLNFTSSAIKKIKEIFKSEKNLNLKFRIYIVGGGCNGFQYGFTLDEKIQEDDFLIHKKNVQIVVDNMSIQYLIGSWIDFLEELEGSRFVVNNPNAKTTCGCGFSFSI